MIKLGISLLNFFQTNSDLINSPLSSLKLPKQLCKNQFPNVLDWVEAHFGTFPETSKKFLDRLPYAASDGVSSLFHCKFISTNLPEALIQHPWLIQPCTLTKQHTKFLSKHRIRNHVYYHRFDLNEWEFPYIQ